jgi:hypothetical protein
MLILPSSNVRLGGGQNGGGLRANRCGRAYDCHGYAASNRLRARMTDRPLAQIAGGLRAHSFDNKNDDPAPGQPCQSQNSATSKPSWITALCLWNAFHANIHRHALHETAVSDTIVGLPLISTRRIRLSLGQCSARRKKLPPAPPGPILSPVL